VRGESPPGRADGASVWAGVLLESVGEAARLPPVACTTTGLGWMRRGFFTGLLPGCLAYGHRDPAGMGAGEIRAYLSHLAVNERVSASTQNQALCALVLLFGRVLGLDLESLEDIEWAKAPKRLPVVLTRGEVKSLLDAVNGVPQLVCRILYGGGLRLVECLSLRVKDIDFERNELTIRDGKGAKDRVSVLPSSSRHDLQEHLKRVRRLHEADLGRGQGRAALPFALAHKYRNADRECERVA
jgi:integrase